MGCQGCLGCEVFDTRTHLLSDLCSICGSCDEESGWPFSPCLGFQELLPAALHGPPRRGPPTGSPPLTFTGRSCGTVSQGLVHADAFRAPALRTCPGRESTVTRGGTHAGHGGECAERRGALRGSGPGRGRVDESDVSVFDPRRRAGHVITLDLGEAARRGRSSTRRSPVTGPPAREGGSAPPVDGGGPALSLPVAPGGPRAPCSFSRLSLPIPAPLPFPLFASIPEFSLPVQSLLCCTETCLRGHGARSRRDPLGRQRTPRGRPSRPRVASQPRAPSAHF